MDKIDNHIKTLKNNLTDVAFLVTQEGTAKDIHSIIVECLIILSNVEKSLSDSDTICVDSNATNLDYIGRQKTSLVFDEESEIKRIERRLKLWAKRPDQINSKILTTFLDLQRSNTSPITENALESRLPEITTFDTNFSQMKNFGEKNHGKVFEQIGNIISIWSPVAHAVHEYERNVFDQE